MAIQVYENTAAGLKRLRKDADEALEQMLDYCVIESESYGETLDKILKSMEDEEAMKTTSAAIWAAAFHRLIDERKSQRN